MSALSLLSELLRQANREHQGSAGERHPHRAEFLFGAVSRTGESLLKPPPWPTTPA